MSLIYGIDVSNNNGSIDFAKVKNAGKQYVYLKATEGATFKDGCMKTFYTNAHAQGIKLGAYHFLVSTSTPEAQAKSFYEQIKDYDWDLAPALDIEKDFTGLSNYVQRFVSAFAQYSNMKLILYTYTGFLSTMSVALSMFEKIWVANYNYKADLTSVAHSLITSNGLEIVGHQYYGDSGLNGECAGVTGACDLDVFISSIALTNNTTIAGSWIIDTTGWWYKHADGTYTKNGWEYINNKWYLFDSKGYMLTSWQRESGNWYYLDETDGDMKTGWNYWKSNWYYMNDSGVMQVGWLKYNNKWYYLNKDGSMATGWITDNGKNYLLYSSGIMACNTTAYGYKFASNGVATKL